MDKVQPLCAVRGLLHGGRAMCGSVINASECGLDGKCEHQRPDGATPRVEVPRYFAVKLKTEDGNNITYSPQGPAFVPAKDFDELRAYCSELIGQIENAKVAVTHANSSAVAAMAANGVYAHLHASAVPEDDLWALIPGTYYMDPPDGGDVPLLEQLRRMSADAAKWRKWLSEGKCDD